ncbi:protein O-mannosyl-transferase TMTC1-like [Denticeps clupeoides]|uniref:dolichyl-phosphate-mannose--protein mannosyltransferase n=1 Tax=Denticeps clupeoides TaxID=299321 RepID=A0AAY4DMR8_9TELE|nr:protein O-mannosyl-transferase TMTC1-like [Denticeps clupeoides]
MTARERVARAGRALALAAACALCYCNALPGELVHDDVWAIVNNPDARGASPVRAAFGNDFWGRALADRASHKSYRPLCVLTFRLNVMLAGMNPFYFHMVNVCLHCAATILFMHTCERCVFNDGCRAFLTALLFAVHPIHTEAVSGVVGRADVLACLLFLLAFLSYIRSVSPSRCEDSFPPTVSVPSLLLCALLGGCAMLVKETGVTVFGVCVVYDALVLCRRPLLAYFSFSRLKQLLRISSPLIKRVGFISIYVVLIMSVRLWLMGGTMPLFSEQDNPASFSPHLLTRCLTYSYLLAFNAWLLLAPIILCYDWQVGSIPLVESLWDPRNGASLLLGVSMLALCVRCALSLQNPESQEVLVGILFLVFPFIPASNLFFRVGFVVAERVLYMPSMGYCILMVHGLHRLYSMSGRWGATILSASTLLLLLLFSWKTVQQNETWLSREALFRSGIQTLPHNAKVHYNYANFLKDHGRNDEAVYHYRTALRLYPQHASAMNNLGTLTRHPEEAEGHYRRALEINPQHNRALFNLGNLLKSQGKEEEAERMLLDSLRFGPHFADAYSSLASLYAEQKRFSEANEIYLRGIESCPDSSDLHNNYGVFLVDTGDSERAAVHYQHAVRLKPAHYVAMVNLGRLLRSANDNKEAESWYKRALQVTRKGDILTLLGALYYNTGRYEEALQVYREAVVLQPDSTEIYLALAQVLAMSGHSKEAEEMTTEIISKSSSCVECYRLLSAIYSKHGNHTQALDALDKALLQNPSDAAVRAELYFSKGNQLREMNQLDEAFESYKLAVELNPDQSQAWMNMGGIQHIKGDYSAARVYYKRALLLTPGSKLLKENLAKLDRLEKKLHAV